jgi:hypothetical protein
MNSVATLKACIPGWLRIQYPNHELCRELLNELKACMDPLRQAPADTSLSISG